MPARTEKQSQELAAKIFRWLRTKIDAACEGSFVPPPFVAGLVSVENSQLNPEAMRFEPHVFEKLKTLRAGSLASYNNIPTSKVKDASDEALRALATSYGLTQIMGWWSIHLKCTVAELRDPEKHLGWGVILLQLTALRDLETEGFERVLRIWNSGSPTGKTHDPAYVANALKVMALYEALERAAEPIEPSYGERLKAVEDRLSAIEERLND